MSSTFNKRTGTYHSSPPRPLSPAERSRHLQLEAEKAARDAARRSPDYWIQHDRGNGHARSL